MHVNTQLKIREQAAFDVFFVPPAFMRKKKKKTLIGVSRGENCRASNVPFSPYRYFNGEIVVEPTAPSVWGVSMIVKHPRWAHLHAQLCQAVVTGPFNWTAVLVPVWMHGTGIDWIIKTCPTPVWLTWGVSLFRSLVLDVSPVEQTINRQISLRLTSSMLRNTTTLHSARGNLPCYCLCLVLFPVSSPFTNLFCSTSELKPGPWNFGACAQCLAQFGFAWGANMQWSFSLTLRDLV